MESSGPAVGEKYKEIEETQEVERTLSIKLLYNYNEKTILVPVSENILEQIKEKAHDLFGLSCIRLEIDRKPVISSEQIFSNTSQSICVAGVKNKCSMEKCKNRINLLTSDLECNFCNKAFCMRHSIPEGHSCQNISECREKAAKENHRKLMATKKP